MLAVIENLLITAFSYNACIWRGLIRFIPRVYTKPGLNNSFSEEDSEVLCAKLPNSMILGDTKTNKVSTKH